MGQPIIQTSFAAGELAPKLRSRVDVAKYHSAAATLRNFFVDFSGGGASTRQGTRFINQVKTSGARLIPFQPSATLSYVLEFGQNYIRFFSNGAPILEAAVTGGTGASGNVFTIANTFAVGDWVFAKNWGGLTNVNGNYFIISARSAGSVAVTDLNGQAIVFTGAYTSGGQLQRVYTISSPYLASELFPNPVTGDSGLKYVQDVTSMIFCHPNHPPYILTLNSPTNWTMAAIGFGSTVPAPVNVSATNHGLGAGTYSYGYVVTALDANNQESTPSAPTFLNNVAFLASSPSTAISVGWSAVTGATGYNVYRALVSAQGNPPAGSAYGFIGTLQGGNSTGFIESYPGITPDFAQTIPIANNPIVGGSVDSISLTSGGSYNVVPTVTFPTPSGGTAATAFASLALSSVNIGSPPTVLAVSSNPTGGTLSGFPNGIVLNITSAGGSPFAWTVTAVSIASFGSITGAGTSAPTFGSPTTFNGNPISGTPGSYNFFWTVGSVTLFQGGTGYLSAPSVAFTPGGASATTTITSGSGGGGGATPPTNPSVPGFFQQRLVIAASPAGLQSYNLSQPQSFFNFNTSDPIQDDDAISGSIVSGELNQIKALIPATTGMIALTTKAAWLINGGGGISTSNPITPVNQTANPQAFNGANDLRPVQVNEDIIYGTYKGGYFRDLTYNIYANIYTGADISTLSNHLFFGFNFVDLAWSEEPFKTMWFVRNDGVMLSLGFVKEQELVGWAHHDTNGQFLSVCSVVEMVGGNTVDAVYVIVQRVVNGFTVQYVERMVDRYFPYGYEDAWSVDCALQTVPQVSPLGTLLIAGNVGAVGNAVTLTDIVDTPFTAPMASGNWIVRAGGGIYKITAFTSSSVVTAQVQRVPSFINPYTNRAFPVIAGYTIWQPVTTVTGLTQLIGEAVTGVADGKVVFGMVDATGTLVPALAVPATKVTLGKSFLPQLMTLPLDLGEPTVQSKRKKENAVTLRVADTLGLQVGTRFANCVTMKDFQIGAIPTQSNGPALVTDLVNPSLNPSGPIIDGRQILDPLWQEPGQICIQQNLPYPATILGVIPEVAVGDTK